MPDNENEHNLWHLTNSIAELTFLNENTTADVLVIGGGYTGLSTALHLAEQGKDVVLLEARDIGYGASGRNVGLTNAGLWILPKEAEKRLGVERGKRLNQFLIDAPKYVDQLIAEYKIDCDYSRNGTLHLAHNRAAMGYLKERREQMLEYGADVSLLGRDEAFELTQAARYHGALRDAGAGVLHPLKYCQGLAKIALAKGVRIYKQSALLDIEQLPDGVSAKTEFGSVVAQKMILATNAYEQNLNHNKQFYTPLYYCQLASEPLSAEQRAHCLPHNNGCWDSGAVMRSFRTDADGRLIVGTVGNIYTKTASGFKRWSAHVVGKTFPHIGKLNYQFSWAGRIAKSHNDIPHILQIEPNIYQIMGYSGRGIAPATVTGKMMADYLCENISVDELPLPMNEANSISFNKLRAAIYEAGCQLSHLSDFIIR